MYHLSICHKINYMPFVFKVALTPDPADKIKKRVSYVDAASPDCNFKEAESSNQIFLTRESSLPESANPSFFLLWYLKSVPDLKK